MTEQPEDDGPKKEQPEDDGPKKDEVIFELVKRIYDEGFETKRTLDDKGSNLIGYVTIVTGILVGLGTFDILNELSLPQYYIPYFAGIGLFLATIVFSMSTVRVKEYEFVPKAIDMPEALNNDKWTSKTVMRQFITGATKAIESNQAKNERKALWIRFSWGCLLGGLIFITIYVTIIVYGKLN